MKTLSRSLCAILALLALACATPSSLPAEARPAPQGSVPLRLSVWNVANLFDTVDGPLNDEVLKPDQLKAKLSEVSAVLQTLDGDFVGLVEVENFDCLKQLNQALPVPYPQFGLIEGNDRDRGIDVAFLSRVPVEKVVSHRHHDLPEAPGVSRNYKFSRDCLEVVLSTDPPVTILVNHFKSQLGGKKEAAAKRHVQAQGVVEIATEVARLRPQGIEIVMGDLNDRPDSWSLEPVMEEFVDPFSSWSDSQRATHRSKHGATPLDYILASRDAQSRLSDPKVWQGLGKRTSDHDPVSLTVRLDDVPKQATARSWNRGD